MLSNAEIKKLSDLKDRTGRREQGKFLIEGKRAIEEALTGEAAINMIVISSSIKRSKFSEILGITEERAISIEEIPTIKFSKLSSTETSQGIIAVSDIRTFSSDGLAAKVRSKKKSLVLLLDRISDPGNLGTILRSAAWFGVDAVLIEDGSVDVYNPKVVRSAMAAIAGLDVIQEIHLNEEITKLKSFGFTVVASSQTGKKIYSQYIFPQKTFLVLGSEANGIDKNLFPLCDESVCIPRVGKMESLNVGVASSIILSEIIRQRSAANT